MRSLLRILISGLGVGAAGIGLAAEAEGHATVRSAATATLNVHTAPYGKVLVTGTGETVYLWEKDRRGSQVSACVGACLKSWHFILVKGKPTAGAGVQQSLLGTIKVAGGEELTYNGWPLYTSAADKKPGEMNGEGSKAFGADWWMVSPTGWAVEKGRYESHPIY